MKNLHKIIGLVVCAACFAGCNTADEVPEDDVEPVRPDAVVMKVPTSMEDCETNQVFADRSQARLLTRYEFDNTVEDLLGIETTIARDTFPSENAPSGFENNSDSHIVNPAYVRRLMEASELLSARALSENPGILGCQAQAPECGHEFISTFVPQAFRRPLTDDELQVFLDLFDAVEEKSGFTTAAQMVIETTLQSPQFLYRVEFSDWRAPGSLVVVAPHELAQRLSYFLWGTMPDEELRASADSGLLSEKAEVEAQARRMMADPKMKRNIKHFYRQWLALDSLESMVKDSDLYPKWNSGVSEDWKTSLYAYVTDVHENGGDVHTLMTSSRLFLTERLAPIYGQEPGDGLTMYLGDSEQRSGILTQPAVMALLAYPNQSSPVHRGIFVRERLLCQKIPSPSADLIIVPPDPDPTMTTREIFAEHSSGEDCVGCHRLIDPLGFGFENYDTMGRFRALENGKAVDASGGLFFTRDPSIESDYEGAVELSKLLADAGVVEDCIADHWFMFAMGRPETSADLCSADAARKEFGEEGKFEDLLVTIATSDSFRYRSIQLEVSP